MTLNAKLAVLKITGAYRCPTEGMWFLDTLALGVSINDAWQRLMVGGVTPEGTRF